MADGGLKDAAEAMDAEITLPPGVVYGKYVTVDMTGYRNAEAAGEVSAEVGKISGHDDQRISTQQQLDLESPHHHKAISSSSPLSTSHLPLLESYTHMFEVVPPLRTCKSQFRMQGIFRRRCWIILENGERFPIAVVFETERHVAEDDAAGSKTFIRVRKTTSHRPPSVEVASSSRHDGPRFVLGEHEGPGNSLFKSSLCDNDKRRWRMVRRPGELVVV